MAAEKELVVGALQLPTLGMNATRLEFYLKNAHARGARVMLMGEYVLNHFFKELIKMPPGMVNEQSSKHIELLKSFAIRYDMIFVVPLVRIIKKEFFKVIAKVTPTRVSYYRQQILLPYAHWNEKAWYANPIETLVPPMTFSVDGFRIVAMAGFEMHFDPFWEHVMRKKADLVLLPTASTFGSHNRWREIIRTRAFLSGAYVLRANRLGEYRDEEVKWKFYGDTMLVNPEGEIDMMLEDKESMLIETIYKADVTEHRRSWAFERELRLRDGL